MASELFAWISQETSSIREPADTGDNEKKLCRIHYERGTRARLGSVFLHLLRETSLRRHPDATQ